MKINRLRWVLLPVAAGALCAMFFAGVSAVRLVAFAASAIGWYALSRRKARSLDRERMMAERPVKRY